MSLKTLKQMKDCLISLSKKIGQFFSKKTTTTNTDSNTTKDKNDQGETTMKNTANNNHNEANNNANLNIDLKPFVNYFADEVKPKSKKEIDIHIEFHSKAEEINLQISSTKLMYFVEKGRKYYLLHQIHYIQRPELVRGERHARFVAPIVPKYAAKEAYPYWREHKRKVGKFVYIPEDKLIQFIKDRNAVIVAKKKAGGRGVSIGGWSKYTADIIKKEWGITVEVSSRAKDSIPATHIKPSDIDTAWYEEFKQLTPKQQREFRKQQKIKNKAKALAKAVKETFQKQERDLTSVDFNDRTLFAIQEALSNENQKGE